VSHTYLSSLRLPKTTARVPALALVMTAVAIMVDYDSGGATPPREQVMLAMINPDGLLDVYEKLNEHFFGKDGNSVLNWRDDDNADTIECNDYTIDVSSFNHWG